MSARNKTLRLRGEVANALGAFARDWPAVSQLAVLRVAIALVVSLMSRVIRAGYSGESFWKNVAIMIVITFVMAAAHLMEIAL